MTGQAPCAGCGGSRRCWVCLGLGQLLVRGGAKEPCANCAGSGTCRYCSSRTTPEVVVPEQAATVEDAPLPPVDGGDDAVTREPDPPPAWTGEPDGSPL